MPSKHFLRCGCTFIGSFVSDNISSNSSLDKKKNLYKYIKFEFMSVISKVTLISDWDMLYTMHINDGFKIFVVGPIQYFKNASTTRSQTVRIPSNQSKKIPS